MLTCSSALRYYVQYIRIASTKENFTARFANQNIVLSIFKHVSISCDHLMTAEASFWREFAQRERPLYFTTKRPYTASRSVRRIRAEEKPNDALSERLRAAEREATELRKQLEAARAGKPKEVQPLNKQLLPPNPQSTRSYLHCSVIMFSKTKKD